MARKTIPEVYADIDTLLADNTTGAITPAKLRSVLKGLGDALKQTVGAMVSTSLAVTGITATAKTITGFTSSTTTDVTDLVVTHTTGVLRRPAGGSTKLTLSGTISTQSNRTMVISIKRGTTVIKSRTVEVADRAEGFFIDVADFNSGATDYTATISGNVSTATLTDLSFRAEAVATI